jgi:hypothetical protein
MKDDEKQLLILISQKCKIKEYSVRDLINSGLCAIHHKRCWYLLDKWSSKNLYDYGVSLDLGWLTEDGIRKAKELITEYNNIK